ncbi:uncharacterized protein EDB91DRAFT_1084523 [Suillus paluster]|uniref:uncharacterized protein n=1 Tax=Suillus paluster TaxID=48578 RepID=UPI001B86F7BD|nr:uncharacterized protein EDB91DRAFT_1084523 [Suillus paluster]KAG1733249.1 hypothetical protein EDB91DRAFT_1084523 [Suillus paluster]
MAGMEPTPSKIEDPSAIEGLIFELSQVQLALDPSPTPPTAGDIVVPDDPCNLFLSRLKLKVVMRVIWNDIIEFWVTSINVRVTNIEFRYQVPSAGFRHLVLDAQNLELGTQCPELGTRYLYQYLGLSVYMIHIWAHPSV